MKMTVERLLACVRMGAYRPLNGSLAWEYSRKRRSCITACRGTRRCFITATWMTWSILKANVRIELISRPAERGMGQAIHFLTVGGQSSEIYPHLPSWSNEVGKHHKTKQEMSNWTSSWRYKNQKKHFTTETTGKKNVGGAKSSYSNALLYSFIHSFTHTWAYKVFVE